MSEPIVTWTTPFQRMMTAFNEAGEHLEFGRRQEAWHALGRAFTQFNLLASWLHRNPDPREPKS